MALPAPNIEIAQEVANKAQVLINQFGYYQFLNLVDFMGKDGFVNSLELVIQDSVSQITIYLPSQAEEGIYNGIYYTTNLDNIISEVSNQRQNAVNILNNRERYEAIVSECDKILGSINYKEPSKPAPEFEEFKAYMGNVDVRLNRSEALLEKIAEELGLFKDK